VGVALRFVAALIVGLALVTWLASVIVRDTARHWFEKDIALRSRLAVAGARQALVQHWDAPSELRELLEEITRDERIIGVAACDPRGLVIAQTSVYPRTFGCESLIARMAAGETSEPSAWLSLASGERGPVHVSALPLKDGDRTLGLITLVHDLAFVERRESSTQWFLLISFGVLALAAAGVTLLAARLALRGWIAELRQLIRGGPSRPEFQPVLRDVRELVERLVREHEVEGGGAWTADRLKQTLTRHLHGEKIVIVANREPYIHERRAGETVVLHPASGLVTALEPVLRACSGVWIAHGSGSADRDVVDARDRVLVPPEENSYVLRRVWLSPAEERGYYYGFSNEGLWPLCHLAHTRPTFQSGDWKHYQTINHRFADAVCDEVDVEDPIVLVQDYHFALAPRLIRQRLPRATIIMFWHIPWPSAERFGICPYEQELLDGMLGASILGFHTQSHCNNFVDCVDRFLEARIDRERNAVIRQGRSTLVRSYPISIDWPNRWADQAEPVEVCRAAVLRDLGLEPDTLLGVGVDRLDYTKGIEERLLAVERALERFPDLRGRFTFVQLAAPSRSVIARYQQLTNNITEITNRINARFARGSYRPIVLLRTHHEPPVVFRFYRAADVCYVSSLHDGMNLVAKEFVAARTDERGVLILSRFTGASRELTEALIVNPYDLDEASAAFAAALNMPELEQRERMRALRAIVAEFNVYRWAGTMLADAARLRSQDRLSDRLAEALPWSALQPTTVPPHASRRLLYLARARQTRSTDN
jgi:trehalose 6-phosphate synthase